MIQILSDKYVKPIAFGFLLIFYSEFVFSATHFYTAPAVYATYKKENKRSGPIWEHIKTKTAPTGNGFNIINVKTHRVDSFSRSTKNNSPAIGGPSQPEMQAFQPVNGSNLVDLFSGDFSYNIPLLDVGGYPVNIGYKSGITMDQEASWVGLGWNINPGTITRNLRGIPDDFNGSDSIKKTMSIKTNKTIGLTAGADIELTGFPLTLGASMGFFHNNYKGWGTEVGLNASINSGQKSSGPMSGGLSITNNSQEGVTVSPTLSCKINGEEAKTNSGVAGSVSLSLPYNSRTGLKGLQLSTGITKYGQDAKNQLHSSSSSYSSFISFARPSFTPTISIPYSSSQFSFTAKVGFEMYAFRPGFFLSGYVTAQGIEDEDKTSVLPAYGYMNYEKGGKSGFGLLDFNREKEIPYREKPAIPHIGMPIYTYDAFSITGEGTGGMFRPYRSDIGYINDHYMKTKDHSNRLSVDLGFGNVFHGGLDLNMNRAYTQSGPWVNENAMGNTLGFNASDKNFEAAYFRNPNEKAVNSKAYFQALGNDDVVTVALNQNGRGGSSISATNKLLAFRNKTAVNTINLTQQSALRPTRDKRTQLISYLNAGEAKSVGLSKYIENYTPNQFALSNTCSAINQDAALLDSGTGLNLNTYFFFFNHRRNRFNASTVVSNVALNNPGWLSAYRWTGKLKAPETGTYLIWPVSWGKTRVWLNNQLVVNGYNRFPYINRPVQLNLVAGELYDIRVEYDNFYGLWSWWRGYGFTYLGWKKPSDPANSYRLIPKEVLYPTTDWQSKQLNPGLTVEQRVGGFRKPNHISEINVLNKDGRKYVYGIPVYNLKQKEATFSVDHDKGTSVDGLVQYSATDNSTSNNQGKDAYYSSEELPAYTHSYLLTGILSTDYVDLTGNGISEDDPGDGIKFNYSKICGLGNPYKWRAPYYKGATYNEGLKTYSLDDRGNYVYGEKELWYLHSIESKTMFATFVLDTANRLDGLAIDEDGNKMGSPAKRLKEINLYTKADFLKKGIAARPIKTVHFEYSYELCPGINRPINEAGKLTLKKIWFSYNGNKKGKVNPYVFNYHPNNPNYNIKSYDKWGNFKNPLQNPNSSTTNFISNAEYPYALKDSTLAAFNAAAWTLNDIRLPSGGRIKVDYESDDYAFVQNRRAMEMFQVLKLGSTSDYSKARQALYGSSGDYNYVFIRTSQKVTNKQDVFYQYLKPLTKLFFKMAVVMPSDKYGNGHELVTGYADIDWGAGDAYGRVDDSTVWVKMKGISLKGDGDGNYSPMAKAAIQFLRLNLPSKAYPGSEVGDNLDLRDAVNVVFSLITNIASMFSSYDRTARNNWYCMDIVPIRSYVRLASPVYKKLGGGLRVKRVVVYDNWKAMTGGREASYGQEYDYTTEKEIEGKKLRISSGVASFEPMLGGEENPFRVPIEYVEKIAPMGPVTLGYTEEPLGESLYPSASIGYSKVRVQSIHTKNRRSANGLEETCFYTSYDFPTITDRTIIDDNTKKRFKPALANFLRINARNFLTLSQGFKVELNDMNGKMKSQASFSAVDPMNPISATSYFYKVDDPNAETKHLSNIVPAMNEDGSIDAAASIGKDIELMMDMREQVSVSNGYNVNLNIDFFLVAIWPICLPMALNLAQREETRFRSVATTKVVERHGILDSVIHIEKGSRISTQNILYDSETGDVLLTRTQNLFNDPIYNFSYPAYWAYNGMAPAYRNTGVTLTGLTMKAGKIVGGLPTGTNEQTFFADGDELWVASKQKTGNGPYGDTCNVAYASFPAYSKVWAVDTNAVKGVSNGIFFLDVDGNPFTGNNISLKIIRSGRRNIAASVGSVTSLNNPMVNDGSGLKIVFDSNTKVINAQAQEFKQLWRVDNQFKTKKVCSGQ